METLEEDGLIDREEFSGALHKAAYSLSEHGKVLKSIFNAMYDLGAEY